MTDAPANTTFRLPGLEARAEIRIDRWGIPHIKAENEKDLFFVQGFNAARDRLWQLDLWRKRGLGLLAGDFGPGYLAQDHAARHFLYRGDMAPEWTAYAPDTQAICTAFAAGINAYVRLCDAEPARLPPEFDLFGTRPSRWEPADVVRIRSHALTRNGISEILRANIMALADAETDLLRFELAPPVSPRPEQGISLADIPLAAARLFKLATAAVTFDKARLAAPLDDVWKWTDVTDLGDIVQAITEEGSNNWAVHGSRTETGRPILASDPHRAHAVPSLRYLVHLEAPGLNAIGTGEPTAPGISLGHNDRIGFGLTIFGADQEDVYVYETKDGDWERYRYGDGWKKITRVEERFPVKGHPDQTLTLSFTRHGPILHEDRRKRQVIAMRSVWLSPGSAAYLGSLSYMRCASVQGFSETLEFWGTPSVNHVCADVDGNIGWFTAGFTPVRPNWEGLLPVPGHGSHEWDGFIPADQLPRMRNPPDGFVASANEMNLPADRDPNAPSIGHEWAEVSRAERIKSVLRTGARQTLKTSMALQTDVYSRPAAIICGLLEKTASRQALDERQKRATELLHGWDYCLEGTSAPAALFEIWWMKHLRPALLVRFAPNPIVRQLLLPGDVDRLLALLSQPGSHWDAGERDTMLLSTLSAGFSDCETRLGSEPALWRWGDVHRALFEHAASRIKTAGETDWNVGPLPIGGSRSTPMHAGYRMGDFGVNAGASVRLVLDIGDWDNSVCINTPGQSGDPRSPHYGDLSSLWSKGEYVPLLYSDARIAQETTHLITLLPA
ncbi:penicillin acylase family protein [Neorhizobium galegae]|uniref:penicillin acylase family protein n=1 Tax=Neorhizobium galegae TaxID=399 RepID=UPI0006221191|nr:penicillin acylase family protein [Neorhizobium galegae]CDZ29768.1 Penicillin acylase (Penicillin amidase) [Neorhizobium galegae bv. officinalis]KAA9383758.1 penicillin acylase family protein [Neorhizobium galegae]MCM2500541.1 penicillin acylase family protein [Neorhizobium galegae]MCQ1768202.1 penicillin acylase family protein [Neorhizobium galegae]MCQ1769989.1 penicillin acylase family protein [Neorhizobium galegae]